MLIKPSLGLDDFGCWISQETCANTLQKNGNERFGAVSGSAFLPSLSQRHGAASPVVAELDCELSEFLEGPSVEAL